MNENLYPIIIKNLSHTYGIGDAKKKILFDINLKIKKGSLVVLMGASGSGKTTLLTLIGCLRRIQEGSVKLLGNELSNANEDFLTQTRRSLGFIFQAHNLHESLTAIQNVQMSLDVHEQSYHSEAVLEASKHILEILGLGDRIYYKPGNLSGGQKQRVAIARALVSNPELILADEPTAALDKKSSIDVINILKEVATEYNTTTLLVTHDPRILEMADRIIKMEDGQIVE